MPPVKPYSSRSRSKIRFAVCSWFTEASCKFLKEVHAGDTLYSALEIVALTPQGDSGQVTTRATVHNQRGELVLSGEHKYLLRRHTQDSGQSARE